MSEGVKWGQEKRLQTQVGSVQCDLLKGKFVMLGSSVCIMTGGRGS